MKKLLMHVVGLVLAMSASAVMAANEIKFQKVSSIVSSKYGQSTQSVNFEATVANLAFAKQVFAHLRRNDGVWIDVPLSYNRSVSGNREVWTGSFLPPTNTTYDIQFALKYIVNGQTYWDNNGGNNYFIAKDSGSILTSGLNVYSSGYRPTVTLPAGLTTTSGVVTLRNLSPTKTVRIHYTTNNWATTQIANASYSSFFWAGAYSQAPNPNSYGFEEWSYSLNIGNATQYDYAIEYVVNGQTYWDNNTGLNYHVNIIRQ